MGVQDVQAKLTPDERSQFMRALLRDVQALDTMLERGDFETGICRIGAEQEMVMVDADWQPAPIAMEVLDGDVDPRLTTEIARFNVEANLTPLVFTGSCLRDLERELEEVIAITRGLCREHGADVVLTGILPTLAKSHLGRENISDRPRYFALDEALSSLRGGPYELQIEGLDEVAIEHDSILLEALNTSFQLHYQVEPDTFADLYNIAQAVAAPLLATASNSPVLFGKRLWRETRIAIFQQTVNTRHDVPHERDFLARVRFGERWVDHSPMELFKEDIARFRVILGRGGIEDPYEAMAAGRAPKLQALQLHNSTIYRWNRACYGISDTQPHLRIENRVLPAGPTVPDQVANSAFWFGLMHGGIEGLPNLTQRLDFDDVRSNFYSAARMGMHAELTWMDGRLVQTKALIRDELIPIARAGLERAGIDAADIDRNLGIILERTESRRTGSQWLLESVASMQAQGTRSERLTALTAGIHNRQFPLMPDGSSCPLDARPVHEWDTARLDEGGGWTRNLLRVEQYMNRELRTVHGDDTIDLVVTLMDWEHLRHVPVEDEKHNLIGIVSYRMLLHHLARNMTGDSSNNGSRQGDDSPAAPKKDAYSTAVEDIMRRDPVTVSPETSTIEAIELMRRHGVSCLPVVTNGTRLVGIITEHDFMQIAGQLLEERLRGH